MFRNFKIDENDAFTFVDQDLYKVLISIFVDWIQLFGNNSQGLGGIYAVLSAEYFPFRKTSKT